MALPLLRAYELNFMPPHPILRPLNFGLNLSIYSEIRIRSYARSLNVIAQADDGSTQACIR